MAMWPREWAIRNLRTGDLAGLAALAQGATERDKERIRRLTQRGFLAARQDGRLAITFFGRLALLVRRLSF